MCGLHLDYLTVSNILLVHWECQILTCIVPPFVSRNQEQDQYDPALVQLDDQDCVVAVVQSALAHTLYKIKVRRAGLLGLTLGS